MKTIILNGKKLNVPASIEEGLKTLKYNDFLAKQSEFWHGSNRHKKCYFSYSADEQKLYGNKKISKHYGDLNKKTMKFFKDNPRCDDVVVGNKRRVNAILAKL